MAEELNEDPQWEIKVSVPMRLPVEQRQELFSVVVRAVEEWEPAPAERDGWDADVAGCPAGEWPELVDLQASRQAWAEEAVAVQCRYEDLLGAIWLYVNWHYVTKQLTTEQKNLWADAVDASGDPDDLGPKAERWWAELPCGHTVAEAQRSIRHELCDTGPQCAVHPEGSGVDLAVEGGDPTP